ncbi:MAG: 30S ribosome-binding factor RbfA [Deltaproteobacteria bacterium]|nr:30S ribosome-binding factor RbfA [Deltaproteobacteria bacterium]
MSSHRIERLKEEVRQIVTEILLYEMRDPRFQHIIVTKVHLTKDLSLARIYYEKGATSELKEALQEAFEKAKGFVRRRLASQLKLRIMPQVEFYFDETNQEIQRVEELFSKL